MAEEKCFACGWVFAPDEPSIVIDDREYCTECATEEAEAKETRMAEDMIEIPGLPGYFASPAGVIYGPRERPKSFGPLKTRPGRFGYLRVAVNHGGGKWREPTVHSLVALAFHGPRPEGHHVGHEDGDLTNNRPTNLRYVTPKENEAQKLAHGRRVVGEKKPTAVLTEENVRWIRKHYKAGDREFGASALARRFGLHNTTVLFAATGKTWRHVQ